MTQRLTYIPDSTSFGTHECEYVFPEIPISREDEQFLKEISVKIQMTDPRMLGLSLSQLTNLVLEDFPAEILLQKPDIVKVTII